MPKANKTGLEKTLGFRVSRDVYAVIERIMDKERRIESEVCRALIERGVAAYKRDGNLFEEDAPQYKRVPQTKMHDEKRTGTNNR